MPTKRRKIPVQRIGRLTDTLRAHLECGFYFFDVNGAADHFASKEHRRDMWQAYRHVILTEWGHPGKRPTAFWEYDAGLEPRPWPQGWSWPAPIQSEAEMVHALLKAGRLDGCRRNGTQPIASEVETIEREWLHEIRVAIGGRDTAGTISRPLPTFGTPPWFYREHAPAIAAAQREERRRYYATYGREPAAVPEKPAQAGRNGAGR